MRFLLKVAHRINKTVELKKIPKEYGVEVDIRNEGENLILNHDPFVSGNSFEEFCREYNHAFLLLNVKTEGIEHRVLEMLKKNRIKDYFFLDITFPKILELAGEGEHNIAVRFSEYEPIENALSLKGKVKWVWVDTFTKLPLNKRSYKQIRDAGFKIFLVSPDRWGRESDIEKYSYYLKKNGIKIDAVMSSLELLEKWGG